MPRENVNDLLAFLAVARERVVALVQVVGRANAVLAVPEPSTFSLARTANVVNR